jgi:hypothetical protein
LRGTAAPPGRSTPSSASTAGAVATRGGRPGTIALLLGVVVLAVVGWAVSRAQLDGSPVLPTATDPVDSEVELPPPGQGDGPSLASMGTQPGTAAYAPTGESRDAREGPTCDRAGCAIWRSTAIDQRPLLYEDGVLVHLGGARLVGLDVATGAWLWDVPHSDPRGIRPAAAFSAVALDRWALAIAYGTRVRIHDPDTGLISGELEVAPVNISALSRHDGALVAVGRVRGDDRAHVLGLGEDGTVRWQRQVDAVVRSDGLARQPLLVRDDDLLVRLDGRTGGGVWLLRGLGGAEVVTAGQLVVIDRDAGEVRWLDAQDGSVKLTVEATDVRRATAQPELLTVATDTSIRVIEPDGTQVDRVGHPRAPAAAVLRVAGTTVVALPPAPGVTDVEGEVQLWDRGRLASPVVVPIPRDAPPEVTSVEGEGPEWEVRLEQADHRTVRVIFRDGAADALVDVLTGGITERRVHATAGEPVVRADGLTFVQTSGAELRIVPDTVGAAPLTVRRATQVASTDPLVVHGGAGALLLDRGALERG